MINGGHIYRKPGKIITHSKRGEKRGGLYAGPYKERIEGRIFNPYVTQERILVIGSQTTNN